MGNHRTTDSKKKEKGLTWDELEILALGEMGLAVTEFYLMTPRQFFNKTKGFNTIQERESRAAWERMRFSTTALINIQLEKNKKIKPTDLIRFPWEKEQLKEEGMKLFEQFLK